MPESIPHWLIPTVLALLGACIGSFLNVVIYRSPRGLSLSDPARSFCPKCEHPIPWYRNIPVLSWLMLRGKCTSCKAPISVRYWVVEVITAGLFLAVALSYDNIPVVSQFLICLWIAIAIAIAFIDGETMIVFPQHTLIGGGIGMLAAISYPPLVGSDPGEWTEGLAYSFIGGAAGFILIRLVIELGKLLFGSWKQSYDNEGKWSLREPENAEDELTLVLPDRECGWSELFGRSTDKAILDSATLVIDGEIIPANRITIYENRIETAQGESFMIEGIKSAHGTLKEIKANREAMGSGDAWIMLMVGALCGWEGSIFTLVCACLIGLVVALCGRLGFGRPIPFGPSLMAAAAIWLFYGKQLWVMYLIWIAP